MTAPVNKLLLRIAAAALVGSGNHAMAAPHFDCATLSLSGAAVPRGYSGQCASEGSAPAIGNDVRVPADIGFALDILARRQHLLDRMD